MSEKHMWQVLKKKMGDDWAASRHEDTLGQGIPDVSFTTYGVSGWIELKHTPHWPKRDSTLVRIPDFKPEQKNWMRQRIQHGGKCWLLWQIEKDWFLMSGERAIRFVGETKMALIKSHLWLRKPDWVHVIKYTLRG